jgi:hypothetical protein
MMRSVFVFQVPKDDSACLTCLAELAASSPLLLLNGCTHDVGMLTIISIIITTVPMLGVEQHHTNITLCKLLMLYLKGFVSLRLYMVVFQLKMSIAVGSFLYYS